MQRYTLDCTSFDLMDKDNQGCWVRYDEARAEIERLEKEVERLTLFNNECRRSLSFVADQRDTSWNDAIDAAAKECGHHLSTESDVFLANDIASRIRALKRSTQ